MPTPTDWALAIAVRPLCIPSTQPEPGRVRHWLVGPLTQLQWPTDVQVCHTHCLMEPVNSPERQELPMVLLRWQMGKIRPSEVTGPALGGREGWGWSHIGVICSGVPARPWEPASNHSVNHTNENWTNLWSHPFFILKLRNGNTLSFRLDGLCK